MSLNVSVHIVIAADSCRNPSAALARALDDAGVRPQDQRGSSVSPRTDDGDTVELRAAVIADDDHAVTSALVAALTAQGVNVISAAPKATLVEPTALNAQGAHFDIATGTLTVETSAAEWSDLSIKVLRTEDSIKGLMASSTHGRVEDGLPGLFHIIIRRQGGQFTEV